MQMIASHKVPTTVTVSSIAYANMVFNLDAAGYGALPGNVITTSASFTSNSQYANIAGSSGTAMGTGDFTWECWVRPTANVGYQTFIDTRTTPSDTAGFYFGTDNNTSLTPIVYTTATILSASANLTLNTWSHVALTRSSGNLTIWIDGLNRGNLVGDTTNLTEQKANIGGSNGSSIIGQMSFLRMIKGTAQYTANFTPSTSTLRPIAGTQLLLPLVATPFMDISTNEFTVTNNGSITTTASAPTLTAVTTDLTGTYAMTRTGASISWKSLGTGGYFEKNNATGTDHITGGPNYNTAQSYTFFAAYQADTRSGGRMFNSSTEAVNDWTAGVYFNGSSYYKNVWFPSTDVSLTTSNPSGLFTTNSGWNFIWGTWDKTDGNAKVYVAASGVNSTIGPTDVYKYSNVGLTATHGFNQLRLWSRYFAGEVQSGNIGLVRVYDGVMPLAQIQSTWANLHSRFGI